MAEGRRFPVAAMLAFTRDALLAHGVPAADAELAAKQMIEADLTGFDAHGIMRLGNYCNWIKSGRVNPKANIKVLQRSPATALVDGDDGIGHLVMTYAMNLAIELARASGVGWVGARNSNHAGAAGIYPEMAGRARHGRHLRRGLDDEPHGAVGRRRGADGNEPDRDRDPGRQGSAGGARHRHLGVVVRQHPAASRPGKPLAGGLGGAQQDRRADHRSEEGR